MNLLVECNYQRFKHGDKVVVIESWDNQEFFISVGKCIKSIYEIASVFANNNRELNLKVSKFL